MQHSLPSLNALRAFETVSRHLNYRRAADELHVTPAAVKQLVTKLEVSLSIQLFEKKGRCIQLTKVGRSLSNDLSTGFTQIIHSIERVRKQSSRKCLIISVDPSFASSWLIPKLAEFRTLNPELDLLVDASMRVVDLENDNTDIAIRFGVPSNSRFYTQRLFDERLAALCSPIILKGPNKLSKIENLQHVKILRWDLSEFEWARNTQRWNHWKYWLEQVGASHVTPGPGLRVNDYNMALQAAIAGQGMIIGSLPILADMIEQNILCNPFNKVAETDLGYDLVTTQSSLSNIDVRKFVAWISEKVR